MSTTVYHAVSFVCLLLVNDNKVVTILKVIGVQWIHISAAM